MRFPATKNEKTDFIANRCICGLKALLHPTGLEPVTFGSVGRMRQIAKSYKNALFRSILTNKEALSSTIKHHLSHAGFIGVYG